MPRFIRKHSTALIALAVYHFVFFFPVIFMGRVVSPNDVFFDFDPWALYRPDSIRSIQNHLMNDPATGYLPMIAMVKRGLDTFHWNPYLASGIPGFGSAAAASLTPFILLPILLVPLKWVYTAIAVLKLNAAFWFAYLWLREERLGKRGAAIGAIVIGAAGVYSVRWLWQMTNATALYPALLWLVRRAFNGRRSAVLLVTLVALSYAYAGFPAASAYGAYLTLAYAMFLALRFRRIPIVPIGRGVLGVVIALLIAIPSLVPFAQLVKRTGYLTIREQASFRHFYPWSHAKAFFDPDYLGNPTYSNWTGDKALGILNNYFEATVYLGIAALLLAPLALVNRRARGRFFWVGALAVIVCAMFGVPPLAAMIGALPGFKYSALARAVILLPIPMGYLAAAGAAYLMRVLSRATFRNFAAAAIVMAASWDLGTFAGRYYPYLTPNEATVPVTPTIRYLRSQPGPFRVAPFFNYFWPNAAELFGVQDLRSHFSSESEYRSILERIDQNARLRTSTVVEFNSLTFNFYDPLVSMLGVRYFIEHKSIDIIKWKVFEGTRPAVKQTGYLDVAPGQTVHRSIRVDEEPFYSIELPVLLGEKRLGGRLNVALQKFGLTAWSRDFTEEDIKVLDKIYVPLRPFARLGDEVTLLITPVGMPVTLLEGQQGKPNDFPLYYGRVMTPVMFERELPDSRIFVNVGEVPRFRASTRLRKMTPAEFMATGPIDFDAESIITDENVAPGETGAASVDLAVYTPGEQRIATNSATPFFLASSEKLTPELGITIDGKSAPPVEINMLFAGVQVPPGRHEVVFSRRIARGWWWTALLGAAMLMVATVMDERRRWMARRPRRISVERRAPSPAGR